MIRKKLLGLAGLALVLLPAITLSSEATSLKDIMQGLRNDLVEIADGLLMDDFEQVARGAIAIAEHPRIPADQVQLVAQELGPEMPAFKQIDTVVHDLSLKIHAAAEAHDRDAAITAYQQMIEGCFGCHAAYKERVALVLQEVP